VHVLVKNITVSLSFILIKNKKIEYYIKIKTYKHIVLRF